MCGLAGQFGPGTSAAATARLSALLDHRGPDDHGTWSDDDSQIALGHRRLSVLDKSTAGHQPMISASGRYVVAYNGEIYNHLELRDDLRGVDWRGHSDTETMLAAIERWGLERALARFVGMFAFALWDRDTRELSLVRDRLGIKPLYVGFSSSIVLFASELRAIRADPSFDRAVNRNAISLLLQFNSIPAPHTIYERAFKVRPGTIVRFREPTKSSMKETVYWSVSDVAEKAQLDQFDGSPEEAVDRVDALLRDAVRMRMLADVPLGAFLSGGVDSSAVVALMQAQSGRKVKTFSIGSTDLAYDEAPSARAIASHIGTDHTELYVTASEALDVVPKIPTMYDEPFADSSQIPTFLVSQMARESVTVALSGDGGDEVFAGYNRHVWAAKLWKRAKWVPRPARSGLANVIESIAPQTWDRGFERMHWCLPGWLHQRRPGFKLHKLARGLPAKNPMEFYDRLSSLWPDPAGVVRGADSLQRSCAPDLSDFTSQMMLSDMRRYLPDDILCKVDRASMAVSLEVRVPYLDHRVVEFAWRLPMNLKLRDRQGKWVLRQVLNRYVPRNLIDKRKAGFGIPIGSWLRGPLREWAEELLDEHRLARDGYFEPGPIRQAWADHLDGSRSLEHELWAVLMFQAWLEQSRRTGSQGDYE